MTTDRPIALTPSRLLALAAFGGVVITFFDGFHTHSGTTRYATTVLCEAAWWAPLPFALGMGVGGPAYVLGYRALGGRRPPAAWPALGAAFAAYGALYAFSGYYAGSNAAKLAALAAAAVLLHAWLDRTLAGASMALVTAIVGPLVEVVLVHAGVFTHLKADVLGVPVWLPALYACSAVVIGQGARRWLEVPGDETRPAGV